MRLTQLRGIQTAMMPAIRKPKTSHRERFNRLVGVPLFDALAHAMAEVSVENHERQAVERPVRRVELCKDVLAGNVLRKHLLDASQLSDDLLQPQLERRHVFNAFSHPSILL